MAIQVGDRIPQATLHLMTDNGPAPVTTEELFSGKRVVLFGLPGAFTPTCSAAHLPGYVVHADEILNKGVNAIVCVSVNDAFVMDAWGKTQNVDDKVMMVADGNGEFTQALGLELDLTGRGLGVRSQRYAMIVEDGVVKHINIEDSPGKAEKSSAETTLGLL
ncbi:MAG: peroxiredoxin [Gammaproteobacteria bacterium]|nr:peroxiredoxin [Gammaproteobacteria bacterium]NIR83656.1 peroxiredoxin [Gammaproteobacteria bacterium]NIR91631.1 peroxiredoxin [Gammaproteobacteria bacterium]NIU04818.1 peroxiredoxin [Gammaproteobacteria bacterium]NIV51804.1 redoxin family protein [Gammaproteobacteria bacterium]